LQDRYEALIFANGNPVKRPLLNALCKRCSYIIALDGGLATLRRRNIIPDHVIGDFDSVSDSDLEWARRNGSKLHCRPSQDIPDLAKGFYLCKRLHYRSILVTSFEGARVDHVLSTVHFVLNIVGIRADLITDEMILLPLHGRTTRRYEIPCGHLVSWFGSPLAEGCSLCGVRWPFRNRTIRADGFHSLSNQTLGSDVELSQRRGRSVFMTSLQPTL